RGGAWLALGGGIVGGMLVAFAVWLLGLSGTLGMPSRSASSQEATSADTAGIPAAAAATTGTVALPTSLAPKNDATALVPALGADSTRALAPGVDSTRAPASGSDSTRVPALGANPVRAPTLGADAIRVPAIGAGSSLSGAASSLKPAPAPTPLPKPMPLETEALEAPQRATAPVRPVLPDPPMQKLAKAEVSTQTDPLAERRGDSQTGRVEEDEDEDLGLDEEFERELTNPAKRATPPKRTVWVPPAPQLVEPAVTLSQSDIFSVVVSNKSDITSCVSAQKLQSEEGHRRVVVRWNILPSGKVTEVFTETAGYQGTPLALCLEEKIRSWSFPKHREQGGPVRFPFVF
ncbi:AgmX/PglI C-terminal domain-containing protein, partial [Hyalangium sp.]|uniref:AgmX/PglI C-terminal domain-containing protein n=1 Tax=Hyalangium sp. TaxID=2028555 RepID=UPI002D457A31